MAPRKQPWFRFYVEAMTDPKLRRLTPAQKWLWVVVLGSAKQSPIEGWLMLTEREPVTVEDLADLAGMKAKDVDVGLAALARLGLVQTDINLGAWEVVAWHRRQYASDDVSLRVRKHRSNDDPPPAPPDGDGTLHRPPMERSMNGDGTHQSTETETDTPLEVPQGSEYPTSDSGEQARRSPSRGHQFPRQWAITEHHRSLASQRSLDVSAEAEAFEDFHRSKGSTFKDWDRAFNTWLRNADRFSRRSGRADDDRGSDDPNVRAAAYGTFIADRTRPAWMDVKDA